jgi:hypothetical protein
MVLELSESVTGEPFKDNLGQLWGGETGYGRCGAGQYLGLQRCSGGGGGLW